ncbi:hypothetical protein D3C84_1245970 [compost metagenome]
MLARLDRRQDVQTIGMPDGLALFAQEMLGGQIRIGLDLGRGAVVDHLLIGRRLQVQINTQRAQ